MTSVSLSPVAVQDFFINGAPAVGGLLFIYAAGTENKIVTYTDSSGDNDQTNPVALNSRGEPENQFGASVGLWIPAGVAYKLVFAPPAASDPPTNPIWTVDNLGGVSGGGSSGIGVTFDTVAELQAATISSSVQSLTLNGYYAAGDGGGAVYTRASPGSGPGKVQSADGQWWILASTPVNVRQFGAKGDGTTAAVDVTAFSAAVAWANARGTASGGVTIRIPDGGYVIDGSITPIVASGVYFKGDSISGASLLASAPASIFTWSGGALEGGLVNMTITYPAAPTAGAAVATLSNASQQQFLNIDVRNIPTFLELGTSSGAPANAINVDNIVGTVNNLGQADIRCRWGNGLFIGAWDTSVLGVGVPASNRTSTMTTVSGKNFIELVDGSWDSIQLSPLVQTNRYWSALYVNAPGSVIQNIWMAGVFDYNSSDAISLNSPLNAMGVVGNVNIAKGTWLVSWSGCGILCTGNNGNQNHDFSGAYIPIAGLHGISLTGSATLGIKMDGVKIANVNRIAGNYSCVDIEAGVTRFSLNNATGRNDTVSGLGWSATYGLSIAADVDDYSVQGCAFQGTTKNYNLAANTGGSTSRFIGANQFADYAGFQTAGIYVKPSTGGAFTNTAATTVEVTATGMNNGISKDAQAFAGVTSGTWSIGPGESLTVAYTGTSAMYFDVKG